VRVEELRRQITNRNRKIGRLLSHGVSSAPHAFAQAAVLPRSRARRGRSLSNKAAREALGATHSALAELARRAPSMAAHYSALMDVVIVELAKLTQIGLDSEDYRPVTAAFSGAKKKLDSAYAQAKKTITSMKNAAAILTAFSALVGAF
jgi:hypothetical protein